MRSRRNAGAMQQSKINSSVAATPDGDRAQHGAIEIALVNNMPAQAMAATEAQFSRLLQAGAGVLPFRLRCYQLPGVPRSTEIDQHLSETHETIDRLYARGADALIVTGAEPRATTLPDEPYWRDLTLLLDWARKNTVTALWSCLAAHAAVLFLDGIERRRAPQKFSGIYRFETNAGDLLMQGAGPTALVPHSRYNGLDQAALVRRGYHISAMSETAGSDLFWRREPSLFVFAQGHPEYFANTLSREYRRDVLRFLSAQRNTYPVLPENYFSADTKRQLEDLRQQAMGSPAPEYEETLDDILSRENFELRWDNDAVRLYRNWFAIIRQATQPATETNEADFHLKTNENDIPAAASS